MGILYTIPCWTFSSFILGFIWTALYGDTVGCIGALLVKKEWRSRGVGTILMEKAMAYLGDHNICVSSVSNVIPYYQSKGFQYTSFQITQFSGSINKHKLQQPKLCVPVTKMTKGMFDLVCKYDETVHQYPRRHFLEEITDPEETITFVTVDNESGTVTGYGCAHLTALDIWFIGPLFANDDIIAKNLWFSLLSTVPEKKKVMFTMVNGNQVTNDIVQEHEFTKDFGETRLWTKCVMDLPFSFGKGLCFEYL